MFVEELTKIRESEGKAEEIRKAAKAAYRQTLRDARSQAGKLVQDAELEAKEIYDGLIREGQAKADREYENFLAKVREQCGSLIDRAKKNEDNAVDLITERIVRSGVDR